MTTPLVIDIETARAASTVDDAIRNMQLVDKIDSRLKDEAKKQAAWDKKADEAGLDASHGRVVAIGYQWGDICEDCITCATISEAVMLKGWAAIIDRLRDNGTGRARPIILIGHNLLGFDLPFLWRRMIVNGIQPPRWLPSPAALKPWSELVFDTMIQWSGTQGRISLKKLAWTLRVPGKMDGMDGSQVQALADAGKWEKIREYCLQDVRTTRAVYDRMTGA